MSKQSAIVLGASGSVGQALLAELVRCGQFSPILVVTRRPVQAQAGAAVQEVLVPDMSPEKLSAAVAQALLGLAGPANQAVGFSTLGVGANTAKLSLEEHRAVDVALNAAFARGLKDSGKVQHLAYMSAMGADPNAKTTGSGAAGMPRYARVKGEAEQAVRREGPPVVSIFQPAMIIGSQHTPRLLEMLLPLFTPLTPKKWRSIRTTEIAKAMVGVAMRGPKESGNYGYPEMMEEGRG